MDPKIKRKGEARIVQCGTCPQWESCFQGDKHPGPQCPPSDDTGPGDLERKIPEAPSPTPEDCK